MDSLLSSPIILLITGITGLAYSYLLIHYASGNRRKKIQDFTVMALFFVMPSLTVFPFSRLHPSLLVETGNWATWTVHWYITIVVLIALKYKAFDLKEDIKALKHDPFIGALLCVALASGMWSETPFFSLTRGLALLIITFIAIHVARKYDMGQILYLTRWSGTLLALFGLILAIAAPGIGLHPKGWRGPMLHPNPFATVIALNAALWLFQAYESKQYRVKSLGLAGLAFVVLLNTNSSGSLGSLGIYLLFYAGLQLLRKVRSRHFAATTDISLIAGIAIAFLMFVNLQFVVEDVFGKSLTFTGRIDVWAGVTDAIRQRAWFGYGYHGFWQEWRGYENPAFDIVASIRYWDPSQAHNGFLEIALYLGATGLILFMGSFLRTLFLLTTGLRSVENTYVPTKFVLIAFVCMANIFYSNLLEARFVWFIYVMVSISSSLDEGHRRKFKTTPSRQLPQEQADSEVLSS